MKLYPGHKSFFTTTRNNNSSKVMIATATTNLPMKRLPRLTNFLVRKRSL
jgi:hypothetical protein